MTASVPGPDRGKLGLSALRQTLEAVEVRIVGGEPIARGPGYEEAVEALMNDLVEALRA